MTITIPPFVCGIIATLFVEICIGTILVRRKERNENGKDKDTTIESNCNQDNSN